MTPTDTNPTMSKPSIGLAAGILFRINPKKCVYEQLDSAGNTFSTATNQHLGRAGVGIGTRLFALASTTNKKRGMLGEWIVTEAPVHEGQSEEQLLFFTQEYRVERTKAQWRITARLHTNIHSMDGDNLDILKASDLGSLCRAQKAQVLTTEQVNYLHALYGLSNSRRNLNCHECGFRWETDAQVNTCPACIRY